MKKPIILNDNYIDVDKVSFISRVDTKVFAHIGRRIYFFTIVVEGKETDIEADEKEDIDKLRNQLIHECGASIESRASGLMPSWFY